MSCIPLFVVKVTVWFSGCLQGNVDDVLANL